MITTRRFVSMALLFALALVLQACGAAPSTGSSGSAASAGAGTTASAAATTGSAASTAGTTASAATASGGQQQKFVYITPSPIGVNAFLSLGKTGLEAAGKKYNATTKVLESTDPSSREENVRAAINDGATLVVVIGFEFADIIPKVAKESPNTQFLIVDQCIDKPPSNVHCAVFREYEAAYLLGVEAGSLTKSNKVGVISAIDIPFLHRYTEGFAQGAKAANPQVAVSTLWIGTDPTAFSDPARAKEQALSMASQGVDQIFAAGAASNLGIFEAAKEKQFFSYGVDVNQCTSAPGFIVDNLLKRVDVVTEKSIDAIMAGNAEPTAVYGLKEQGIGVVPFALDKPESSQCEIMKHPDVIAKVKDAQDKIASGAIKLEDPALKK